MRQRPKSGKKSSIPAKCTSQRRAAEENCNSRRSLLGFVPEAEVKDHSGKDTSFKGTEEETQRSDACKVLCTCDPGADATEADDQKAKPPRRV